MEYTKPLSGFLFNYWALNAAIVISKSKFPVTTSLLFVIIVLPEENTLNVTEDPLLNVVVISLVNLLISILASTYLDLDITMAAFNAQ